MNSSVRSVQTNFSLPRPDLGSCLSFEKMIRDAVRAKRVAKNHATS